MRRRKIRGCDGRAISAERYMAVTADRRPWQDVVNVTVLSRDGYRNNAVLTLTGARRLHAALGQLLRTGRRR